MKKLMENYCKQLLAVEVAYYPCGTKRVQKSFYKATAEI